MSWPGYRWVGYGGAAAAAVAATLIGLGMRPHFELVNIAMVYLLAVVAVALRFTRAPTILTSVLSVAAFDYFFVPPSGTFSVEDPQYVVTFAIMLAGVPVYYIVFARARNNPR